MAIDPISLIAIAIIIVTLLVGYLRKLMMTYTLIIANFLVFGLSIFFSQQLGEVSNQIILDLGFQPLFLSSNHLPQIYTLFTSMFVHANFLHILGNMLVFFFIGAAFERRIGPKKFLFIYLATGVLGALTFSSVNLNSDIPLVGASGAIFGILGAFAFSYPRDEVVMPVPIGIMIIMRIKVIYAAIIFAVFETIIVFLSGQDNVAHLAHFGGLVSGVILAALLVGKQGEKLKKTEGEAVYRNEPASTPDTINFQHLNELATTPQLQSTLERIQKENVLQVRNIWLDHFLERVTCPVCGKPLQHLDRRLWCPDKHFHTDY
ncbi:MAG TPA: rhomboid family intramembrane serine protease [Candidatus Thermoplasmatota archaeon]|nr:rhomboid family intramembrane serine protease [Candidatus Thermoplasmatota archaeon]